MDNYKLAYEIKDEIIENRRTLHMNPEIGFDLPETTSFVMEKLTEMGYSPSIISEEYGGVTATVGKPGKTFLIRADMDALPMLEDTGLDFSSKNNYSHSCGHDTHTAMLLGAAKILKQQEDSLNGTVKLFFQPAEELLTGAGKMVENGILENPKVDCGICIHISGNIEAGVHMRKGPMAAASINFRINVKGVGTHGAMPERGVDPIMIGSNIVTGLQELVTREIPFTKSAVLTIGKFVSGTAVNIIPVDAVIEGTMRTFDLETLEHMKKRMPEVVSNIAKTYRGEATMEFLCDVPVMYNNEDFTGELMGYVEELGKDRFGLYEAIMSTGSEDFAILASKVPGTMIRLGAPDLTKDKQYPMHSPHVTFDEDILPIGAAVYAECAQKWLDKN